MPRKRTTIADAILTYFDDTPLGEARVTLQFATAIVRRREPQAPVKPRTKKRMAKAALKPAAPTQPVQAPPPPPPPGRRAAKPHTPDPGPVGTVGE